MPVSNEQLAEFIKGGDSDLKPVLWERVKKLLYMFAGRYFKRCKDYCERCGVSEWDLKQQAYIAFEHSFAGYDTSRGSYSTYLMFMFKRYVRELFNKDLLNSSDSLDRLLDTESENGETVGDLIPDLSAEKPFDEIAENSIADIVHKAVEQLPDKEQEVIKRTYFKRHTQKEIAADFGVSVQSVSNYARRALGMLRKNKDIQRLGDELRYSSQRAYQNSLSSFKRYGMSGVERVAIERADTERNLKEWYKRTELLREQVLSGGSFAEYEKLYAEIRKQYLESEQV
jgi:RNA polymerase sigma factor (sigma-70 family)